MRLVFVLESYAAKLAIDWVYRLKKTSWSAGFFAANQGAD